jgi:hypothetical protein
MKDKAKARLEDKAKARLEDKAKARLEERREKRLQREERQRQREQAAATPPFSPPDKPSIPATPTGDLPPVKLRRPKRPWLQDCVLWLIGKERLERWKDQIAEYWERAIDGIDQGKLLRVLTRLYGKKEGKNLLRASRSDKVKAIVDAEAGWLVNRLVGKVEKIVRGPEDRLEATDLRLKEHPYSEAEVIHEGTTTRYDVDGIICITGTVTAHHPGGSKSAVTVFPRWISHPFWQYAHRTSELPADGS